MPQGTPLLDWNGLVLTNVKEQLEYFRQQGQDSTLRGMFYTLGVIGVLPNIQKVYKTFSHHTARWRENGQLPIDCFVDDTRRISKDFDDEYIDPFWYVRRGTNYLRFAYKYYTIPRWHNQPNYVEVWLEKNSAYRNIKSIVKGLDVIVAPNSGNSSVAFFNANVDRLKEKQKEGKEIYIIYLGDCDPSGEEMINTYLRKFKEYKIYNVHFIHLAVTMDQVMRFNLLTDPDPKTLAKLQRDNNRFKFMEKYNLTKISDDPNTEYSYRKNNETGEVKRYDYSRVIEQVKDKKTGKIRYVKHDPTKLFAVELEAMQAPNVRDYLKNLLRDTIEGLFYNDIYILAQAEKPTEEQMMRLVLSEIKDLAKYIRKYYLR